MILHSARFQMQGPSSSGRAHSESRSDSDSASASEVLRLVTVTHRLQSRPRVLRVRVRVRRLPARRPVPGPPSQTLLCPGPSSSVPLLDGIMFTRRRPDGGLGPDNWPGLGRPGRAAASGHDQAGPAQRPTPGDARRLVGAHAPAHSSPSPRGLGPATPARLRRTCTLAHIYI